MGLRFRKSINLGHGFRINLSKKGVGVSGGIKGARCSINSSGRMTRSIGIPGSGLYYVKTKKIGAKTNHTKIDNSSSLNSSSVSPQNNNHNERTSIFKKLLNHVPGYRSRSNINMVIASIYYILTLFMASVFKELCAFILITMWSIPFVIFSVIDAIKLKKAKKLITIPICFILMIISATFADTTVTPTEIHITNEEIVFDDINQEQIIEYTVIPKNADTSNLELISNNTDISYFDGDVLYSKSEGETTIYITLKNSDIKSEEIPVTVKDKQAEAERAAQQAAEAARIEAEKQAAEAARIEAEKQAAEAAKAEAEKQAAETSNVKEEQEQNAEKKSQKAAEENSPEATGEQTQKATSENSKKEAATTQNAASNSVSSNSNDSSQTVYIGNTGTKYHRQSCSTLKGNGHAISLSEALKQGREPCKRCKP